MLIQPVQHWQIQTTWAIISSVSFVLMVTNFSYQQQKIGILKSSNSLPNWQKIICRSRWKESRANFTWCFLSSYPVEGTLNLFAIHGEILGRCNVCVFEMCNNSWKYMFDVYLCVVLNLHDLAEVIKKIIEKNPDTLNFNVIAISKRTWAALKKHKFINSCFSLSGSW